jgi:hypothetical protein
MDVSLSTGQAGVPQRYLHHGQIGVSRDKVRRQRVFQDMYEPFLRWEFGSFSVLPEYPIDLLAC